MSLFFNINIHKFKFKEGNTMNNNIKIGAKIGAGVGVAAQATAG